jgi:hypothetical protein
MLPSHDRSRYKKKLGGGKLRAFDAGTADRRSRPDRGHVLRLEPRPCAALADIADLDRPAQHACKRERCPEDLPAALAVRTVYLEDLLCTEWRHALQYSKIPDKRTVVPAENKNLEPGPDIRYIHVYIPVMVS